MKPLTKAQLALEFSSTRATYAPAGHQRLTINLPQALHKQLRQAALDRNCNATDIIVTLLEKDLNAPRTL